MNNKNFHHIKRPVFLFILCQFKMAKVILINTLSHIYLRLGSSASEHKLLSSHEKFISFTTCRLFIVVSELKKSLFSSRSMQHSISSSLGHFSSKLFHKGWVPPSG